MGLTEDGVGLTGRGEVAHGKAGWLGLGHTTSL